MAGRPLVAALRAGKSDTFDLRGGSRFSKSVPTLTPIGPGGRRHEDDSDDSDESDGGGGGGGGRRVGGGSVRVTGKHGTTASHGHRGSGGGGSGPRSGRHSPKLPSKVAGREGALYYGSGLGLKRGPPAVKSAGSAKHILQKILASMPT